MFQYIGERLRSKREALNISVQDASLDTRIKRKYIEAIESGNFEALPTVIQVRGFLRNYAQYLKEDPEEILDQLDVAYAQQAASGGIGRLLKRKPKDTAQPQPPAPPTREQNYYQPQATEVEADTASNAGVGGFFKRHLLPGDLPTETDALDADSQQAAHVAKNRLGKIMRRRTNTEVPPAFEGADDYDAPFRELDTFKRELDAPNFTDPVSADQPISEEKTAPPTYVEPPFFGPADNFSQAPQPYAPTTRVPMPYDTPAPEVVSPAPEEEPEPQPKSGLQTGPLLKRWYKRGEEPLEPMRKAPKRPQRQPSLQPVEQPENDQHRAPAETGILNPPDTGTAPVYEPPQERRIPLRYRLRRFFTIDLFITGAFLLGTVGLIVWFSVNRLPDLNVNIDATPQRVSADRTPTIVPTETQAGPLTSADGAFLSVALNIDVTQMTYLRLTVDGVVEYDGQAVAGQSFNYLNVQSVDLAASNARALNIVHNEAEYLPLGNFGEIVSVLFEPNERIYATPEALTAVQPSAQATPDAPEGDAAEADPETDAEAVEGEDASAPADEEEAEQ